jgi:ADP-ribose pyrophosphatase YjhB (NUDIX family)
MRPFLARIGRGRSAQIILVVALYLSLASSLPLEVHQGLYAISLFIKDLLLWFLPITVSFFIAYAISSFEKRAPLFILSLFLFEALSNFMSVWYSFGFGHLVAQYLGAPMPHHLSNVFDPLWRLPLIKPAWWSADKGSLIGIAVGLSAVFNFPRLGLVIKTGKETAEKILTQVFSRLIPLFILGFVARMYKTQLLNQMLTQYTDFLLGLFLCLGSYIALLFLMGSGFSKPLFFKSIKNLLPAAGVAFSSGCSLSTMPWTIEGTAKNLRDPDLAKAVIPATTNVQQIGDCIANTFLCFLLYFHFNGHLPPLSIWIPFTLVFVLARFATAAVLGGAIFIMLPIYESYLGFTPEMIAMILAFNVILDPLITCSNVVANGALCRIFERVWRQVLQRFTPVKKQGDKTSLRPKVGVGVFVFKEGKVLLGRRKGAHGAGDWAPPGGHLEFGESIEDCAKRELYEETALRALSMQTGAWSNDVIDGTKHYITFFAVVKDFEGEPKLLEPQKCEEWLWFSMDALPSPLFLPASSFLAQYKVSQHHTVEAVL